ncbi:hypothetical protein [Yinghuangia soli]|uniref:Uncharacterized protein n=1 Tax=Yinghuangia soli TaxID=2908204 RepID=A0AA41U209_9ACTN|nr:hypothetical protein [Yinghuangia soli]MCF2531298.1 hypothetical protein [Yinghuangia soli]
MRARTIRGATQPCTTRSTALALRAPAVGPATVTSSAAPGVAGGCGAVVPVAAVAGIGRRRVLRARTVGSATRRETPGGTTTIGAAVAVARPCGAVVPVPAVVVAVAAVAGVGRRRVLRARTAGRATRRETTGGTATVSEAVAVAWHTAAGAAAIARGAAPGVAGRRCAVAAVAGVGRRRVVGARAVA